MSTFPTSSDEKEKGTGGIGWTVRHDIGIHRVQGDGFMQIDHANISTVLQLDDDQLREVRRLLTWGTRLVSNRTAQFASALSTASLCGLGLYWLLERVSSS